MLMKCSKIVSPLDINYIFAHMLNGKTLSFRERDYIGNTEVEWDGDGSLLDLVEDQVRNVLEKRSLYNGEKNFKL